MEKEKRVKIYYVIGILIFVLFIFSCDSNTPENTKKNQKEYKIILEANDPKNPLHVWRIPITSYWIDLSNKILGEFGNQLTPHQKAILFMTFMNDFKVGFPSKADPITVVEEKIGACGTYSNVFCALMIVNNIPCRIVNLHNYPTNYGHTVVEVFYDNKWHLYDPTYAAYYTTTPNEIKNPTVLSFEELRKCYGFRHEVVRIILNPKRLYEGLPVSLSFAGPDIFVKANPAGPIGPDKPFFYPIYLDLTNKNIINKEDFGPRNQGAYYIGAAGINNNWIVILSNLKPLKKHTLTISPEYLGGEFNPDKDIFYAKAIPVSKGCKIIRGSNYQARVNDIKDWLIEFIPDSNECKIKIFHSYKGPNFFYLKIKLIKLSKVNK